MLIYDLILQCIILHLLMCILHNAHKLGKLSLDNCNSLNLPVINSAACIHRYAATSKRRGTEIRLHPYVLARSDSNVYKQ